MRTHVQDGVYYDFESGTFFTRPTINGRRTWRAINANSVDEALAIIAGVKVETVKELIDRYIAAGVPTKLGGKRMSKREEVADLKRIAAQFGPRKVSSITNTDVLMHLRARDKPRAADREMQALSNAFNWGVRSGYVTDNPIIHRPRAERKQRVRHSREVMPPNSDALHSVVGELFQHPLSESTGWLAIILAFTGLRVSEALQLRRDAKSKADPGWIEGDYLFVRRAKAGKFPYVKIHPQLRAALDCHARWIKDIDTPWWFPGRDLKSHLTRFAVTGRLHVVCERLGIPTITGHGLRAYFVTVMRSRGLTDDQVAALIGDSTASLISTTYGNLPESWAGGAPMEFYPNKVPVCWGYLP